MAVGLLGGLAVIALMVLSGMHVQITWLKWILRTVMLVSVVGVEALILLYWAHNPRGPRPGGNRSPMTAEAENYPE